MTFIDADHPRGHASNTGSFSEKTQGKPEISGFAAEAAGRTPEQIAEFVAWQTYFAKGKSDHERIVLTRNGFVSFLTAAAIAATREEQVAPKFKPAEEPDDWRDDAENIGDTDTVDVGWTVNSADGTTMIQTDFTLTAGQARRILAMLSSDDA